MAHKAEDIYCLALCRKFKLDSMEIEANPAFFPGRWRSKVTLDGTGTIKGKTDWKERLRPNLTKFLMPLDSIWG